MRIPDCTQCLATYVVHRASLLTTKKPKLFSALVAEGSWFSPLEERYNPIYKTTEYPAGIIKSHSKFNTSRYSSPP